MAIIILISAILNLFLGIFVLKKSTNKIQKYFGILILFIVTWLFLNAIYFIKPEYPFIQLTYGFGSIVIASIFFWVIIFTQTTIRSLNKYLIGGVTLFLAVISMIPNFLIQSTVTPIIFGFNSDKEPFFLIYAIIEAIILIWASYLLLQYYSKSHGIYRVQTSYVIAGFIIPIALVILIDFILPLFHLNWIDSLDNLTSLLFVGFISYAITRYRLFDLRIVIRKGAIQLATFLILFAVYSYVLLFTQEIWKRTSQVSESSLLFTVIIIVITVEPLRRIIYKYIGKLFESKEKDRKDALQKLQILTLSIVQFEQLVSESTKMLKDVLGSDVNFLLIDRKERVIKGHKLGITQISLESLAAQEVLRGKILITDELDYRIKDGETNLQEVLSWAKKSHYCAIIPLGGQGDCVGIFALLDSGTKMAFTSDKINFLKQFSRQLYFSFASSLAYRQAVERIKI